MLTNMKTFHVYFRRKIKNPPPVGGEYRIRQRGNMNEIRTEK